MKITIEVDCSPEEARAFLGLPNLEPLQTAMMKDIEDRMKSGMAMMDPDSLMKNWSALGGAGLEQFQSFMRETLSAAASDAAKAKK